MRNNRTYIRIGLLLSVLVLFTAALIFESYRGTTQLRVVNYTVSTKLTEFVRIVQLSDLHSWTFGEENAELITQVETLEPDIIVMTGDMLDKSEENANVVCDLIRALVNTAPVYYCYGNHEYQWMQSRGESLTPALEASGAIVLDVSYKDITVKHQPIRIGGYHGYYRQPGMFDVSQEQREAELAFCDDFESTESYKLLLCHIPTPWLDWG